MCSPEITAYQWQYDKKGEIQCLDEFVEPPVNGAFQWGEGYGPGGVPGCRRALCECDKEQIYGALISGDFVINLTFSVETRSTSNRGVECQVSSIFRRLPLRVVQAQAKGKGNGKLELLW